MHMTTNGVTIHCDTKHTYHRNWSTLCTRHTMHSSANVIFNVNLLKCNAVASFIEDWSIWSCLRIYCVERQNTEISHCSWSKSNSFVHDKTWLKYKAHPFDICLLIFWTFSEQCFAVFESFHLSQFHFEVSTEHIIIVVVILPKVFVNVNEMFIQPRRLQQPKPNCTKWIFTETFFDMYLILLLSVYMHLLLVDMGLVCVCYSSL